MMSEWKLVDVEGIGSGYACLTLDGVSTTKSRNLIQADRGAGGDPRVRGRAGADSGSFAGAGRYAGKENGVEGRD